MAHRPFTLTVGVTRTTDPRDGVRVELVGADGVRGVGQVVPLEGRSRDDATAALVAVGRLGTVALPDLSLGVPALAEAAPSVHADKTPGARFALESALLDAAFQVTGLPPWVVLGGELGAPSPTSHARIFDPGELGAVLEALRSGYTTLKVKIGRREFDDTLGDLIRLRNFVGSEIAVRIDVNAAWTLAEARQNLEALAKMAPEFVEQPVAPELMSQL